MYHHTLSLRVVEALARLYVCKHLLVSFATSLPQVTKTYHLGPKLQCLFKIKEDLSLVLIVQEAKNNVSN